MDRILYTQDYEFTIDPSFDNQEIAIKLIVTKLPNTLCFPDDNGIDTLVQSIHATPFCNSSVWGDWYGSWDNNPTDSFLISFYNQDASFPSTADCAEHYVSGYNHDATENTLYELLGITDNYLNFSSSYGPGWAPQGQVYLDESSHFITIQYSLLTTNIPPIGNGSRNQFAFHGRRIN